MTLRSVICPHPDHLPLVSMGVCPLLFVATSTLNAAIMGGVFMIVLVVSNALLSLLRLLIPYGVRLPIVLLVTTLVANVASLLLNAFYSQWDPLLSIYVPLLGVNCLILNHAEAHALRCGLKETVCQNFRIGLYIFGILLCVGFIRELLSGVIVAGFEVALAGLPSGAFLLIGGLIAWAQSVNNRHKRDVYLEPRETYRDI